VASAKNKKNTNNKRDNVLQNSNAHNRQAKPVVASARNNKKPTGKLLDAAVTGLEFVS
jgi:hypothetical protein